MGDVEMTEDEQATGGYVICGKPYIIGDDSAYWTGWRVPDGFEITNDFHADGMNIETSELIRTMVRKAMEQR